MIHVTWMNLLCRRLLMAVSLMVFLSLVPSCSRGAGHTSSASPAVPSTSINLPTTSPATSLPNAVTFDFDSGSPTPLLRQSTPVDLTAGDITAHFSSPTDPAAFSIQDHSTTNFNLSLFSGNYLVVNTVERSILNIKFSKPLVGITLTFATIDYHDPGAGGTASTIQLTAYNGSSTGTPLGSVNAHGTFSADSYPQGTLSFRAANQPFDTVAITVPFMPQGATGFLVDNVVVTALR
jgi:hypothetical protein